MERINGILLLLVMLCGSLSIAVDAQENKASMENKTLMAEVTGEKFATIHPEGIAWDLVRDWSVVMGEKTGEDRYAMRFYIRTGIRWIWGGGILMIGGVILGGWQRRQSCLC